MTIGTKKYHSDLLKRINLAEKQREPRLPPRTKYQILSIISNICASCPKSSHRGNEKTLQSMLCLGPCGCGSVKGTPLVDRLQAISFRCPIGKRLDGKLEELAAAIESLK